MRASQNTDGGRKKPHVFNRIMRQKLTVTLGIVMLALTALLVRTYLIQDQNNEEYSKIVLSQRQSEYTSATLPYKRGDIYDRNGNRLATSEKVYNLILDPRQMADAEGRNEDGTRRRNVVQPTINALCDYFGYDRDELEELVEDNTTMDMEDNIHHNMDSLVFDCNILYLYFLEQLELDHMVYRLHYLLLQKQSQFHNY